MTRRFAQITEITKLMEECQSMGIKTLGPDVNESYRVFGVNAVSYTHLDGGPGTWICGRFGGGLLLGHYQD